MVQRSPLLALKRLILRNLAQRPLYAWYRFVVAKRILSTRPVTCGADTAYELHTLTCEHDLLNTLWSLKTWYHYSSTRPSLVIYAGGPLSDKSVHILSKHFPNCRIIRRDQFNHDMQDFLKNHPACLKHALISPFYCALKLFGPMRYAQSGSVLYFDSDILFFRTPVEILEHIERGTPCYNSDYQDAYTHPAALINKLLSTNLAHKINAGLFHIARQDLTGSFALVETYFTKVPAVDHGTWVVNRHEQTLNALLLSKANAARLGGDYQISRTPVTDSTVSHHFVNDGSRPDFYRVGMRRLVSTGFVKETARAAAQKQFPGEKA
jgi:hypothetical protein